MNIRITIRNIGVLLNSCRNGNNTSKNINRRTVSEVFRIEIEKRRGVVSNSTIENELTAYRSFLNFADKGVTLNRLTPDYFMRYERWLRNQGVIPNTSACYMRSLRAIANRLGLDGKALFKNVKTTKDKAGKKAIDIKTIQKISSIELPQGSFLSCARDMFIFSIMAMGMPFIDLAHLKKTDLRNGFIIYYRHKTQKRIAVRVEPCMEIIIRRYNESQSPYLFPLLIETNPEKTEIEYKRLIGRYNRTLKRIADKCELKKNITSYTARHTWATIANEKGIGLGCISKALAHTSLVTTQNYLKEIDDEGLYKANYQLIQEIFN